MGQDFAIQIYTGVNSCRQRGERFAKAIESVFVLFATASCPNLTLSLISTGKFHHCNARSIVSNIGINNNGISNNVRAVCLHVQVAFEQRTLYIIQRFTYYLCLI